MLVSTSSIPLLLRVDMLAICRPKSLRVPNGITLYKALNSAQPAEPGIAVCKSLPLTRRF